MAIERDKKVAEKVVEKVEKAEPKVESELETRLKELEEQLASLKSNTPKPQKEVEPELLFDIDSIALRTKEDLMKQPKVKLRVPFNPMGTGDALIPININGFRWFLKPGETVEVPEEIAKIFEESYDKTAMANSRVKIENVPT